jgi:TetR/AcrR family transcriptional regulator
MARPRSVGFDLQREQMLASAARLFATRGYSAATMQEVAAACGVNKATLHHYVRDKHDLLAQITRGQVARLELLVHDVQALPLGARPSLIELIERFMQVYARSQNEHRVLTEDVKFLSEDDRLEVLEAQRRVVAAFAEAVADLRPDLRDNRLQTPLAMLLFGMMNWTFTWLRDEGSLTHASLAPLVAALFLGGLPTVKTV